MLKDLFNQQRQYLDTFFKQVDIKQAEAFFQMCLDCQGLLFFTGVGKSGIIAEKIAMTLVSTGTRALYLPPVNLLHGDFGIVSSQDLFVVMSKSGETEELLNLISFVRQRKAKLLAIVSNPNSRLAKAADLFIHLPVEKELCPFDLAPTTSTAIQLIFGDVLAIALMKAKGFTLSDYALNHPSGTIGKRASTIVDELMLKGEELPLCSPRDRLRDVLVHLSEKKCGCLIVTDPTNVLKGIFTDGDLRRALQTRGPSVFEESMETLMTPSPIHIKQGTLAWEAVKFMQRDPKRWIMVLPVVENQKVVGVIRMHDIIHSTI